MHQVSSESKKMANKMANKEKKPHHRQKKQVAALEEEDDAMTELARLMEGLSMVDKCPVEKNRQRGEAGKKGSKPTIRLTFRFNKPTGDDTKLDEAEARLEKRRERNRRRRKNRRTLRSLMKCLDNLAL